MLIFSWKSWYHGTWYHHGAMAPPSPPFRAARSCVFFEEIIEFWVRIFYTCKKWFFRLNPLFPPLEVGRLLKERASRLVQKMTKLRTKSSGARMFTFSWKGKCCVCRHEICCVSRQDIFCVSSVNSHDICCVNTMNRQAI